MISHVFIGVTVYQLGMTCKFSDADQGWTGWMATDQPRPLFVIGKPFEGAHEAGNGMETS